MRLLIVVPCGNIMTKSIIIPVFNQLEFTRQCLTSLTSCCPDLTEIIVIDNGSTDGTGEYLQSLVGLSVISNETNLGCAVAWNQGVRSCSAEWVVILNNDVVLSQGWLAGLIDFAEERGVDVVSPAIREGEYNYDMAEYAGEFVRRMARVSRPGEAHGICFLVRRRVFETVGYFDENFRIGQFEDADFFRRAKAAGFRLAITGRSFIHHFGSMTQKSVAREKTEKPYVAENRAYFRRKWRLNWWKRFLLRRRKKWLDFVRRTKEQALYGHTLMEKWIDGRLRYY
jgi:N-acetylglucosaminyl-diphospho-decaprenol L-rhamnosyltransferase